MRELMRPSTSFASFAERAPKLPAAYIKGRYDVMAHQAGLEDEGPGIPYPGDPLHSAAADRVIQENMIFCLECYAGKEGGSYGVKLEDQALVTNEGAIALNTYPFEKKLL
jgi:Xaa-Pro aminopeptidase